MAVRGIKPFVVDEFGGMDGFTDPEELDPNVWSDALNVVVSPSTNALALRSPASFNTALSTTNKVLSAAYHEGADAIVFDIDVGGSVTTYSTTGSSNTSRKTSQTANKRIQSLNVNGRLFRTNGAAYQFSSAFNDNDIGITAPAAAPSVSFTSGGTLTISSAVTVSYAYRNSTTGHVGQCSAASASTGATTTNNTLRIGVVASSQSGVDGIVLFITEDGGSIRYLVIDTSDDPIVNNNTTGNIDISASYLLNYNVEETAFNVPIPSTITHFSKWKDRVMAAHSTLHGWYYSAYDQIAYGNPWECWPANNFIPIPNKTETAMGGIETDIGWLGLSDQNAYLMTGTPTDKVDAGENTLQFSEHLESLNWGLGTRSPLTVVSTPHGVIWLDQHKHLQFWDGQGKPMEICPGLRNDLATIDDTIGSIDRRFTAEATWHNFGASGGFYVLTAATTNGNNNRMWFITVVRRKDGSLFIAGAPSDIAAQCVVTAKVSGKWRTFIGGTDALFEILAFDTQGAGWSNQNIYFECVVGNHTGNYNTFHSIRFDGLNAKDLIVTSRKFNDTDIHTHKPFLRDGAFFASVHREGARFKVKFSFPTDDTVRREVKNMRPAIKSKALVI